MKKCDGCTTHRGDFVSSFQGLEAGPTPGLLKEIEGQDRSLLVFMSADDGQAAAIDREAVPDLYAAPDLSGQNLQANSCCCVVDFHDLTALFDNPREHVCMLAAGSWLTIEKATQFVNGTAVTAKTISQVDQRLAPSGQTLGGIKWQRLGSVPVIIASGAVNTSGFVNVSLQDLPGANAANGVIVADSVRLVRVDHSLPLELLTLNRNPLGNDALNLISLVLEPAIGDPNGLTPWRELQYTANLNAPTIARTSPISVVHGETTSVANIPGYTPPSGIDPDGGSVTFGYESTSDVNSGSRYFSGDDAVVLPSTLQQSNSAEVAFEFWFSTTKTSSQTLLSAVSSSGANALRIGTQHTAGSTNSNVILQVGSNNYSIAANGSLIDGSPHHLYVALNNLSNVAASATIYVDGLFVGTPTISAAIFALDSVVLGQAQTSVRGGYVPANAFVGTLDELRIWTKPRAPTQITGDRSLRLTS